MAFIVILDPGRIRRPGRRFLVSNLTAGESYSVYPIGFVKIELHYLYQVD